jgi:hypothetical protein
MAKYEEVFADTQALFTNFIGQIDSLNEVNIDILAVNKLKEIGKVVKANDITKFKTGFDIFIYLNERVFEQLDAEQQQMVVEGLVAQIYYDMEKDKLMLIKPDFTTFSLLLVKYGHEKCLTLNTLIKEIFGSEAQSDDENNNPE